MRNYKKFSKKTSALFLSLIVTMTSTIALPSTISAATIKLNKTAATIQVGKKTTLSVKGTSKKVTWSSKNRTIASVNKKGVVTGKKKGTTYIYAKVGGKTLRCKITVKAKTTSSSTSASTSIVVNGTSLKLGDSVSTLKTKFGEPARIDKSIYSFDYYIYNNQDYKHFFMVGVQNNKVVAFYSDTATFQVGQLNPSCSISKVNSILKTSISSTETEASVTSNGLNYHLFFDQLGNKNLVGVLVSSVPLTQKTRTSTILAAEEKEIFDLCNSARVREGLSPFTWSDKAATASRNHSVDMMKNNYFSHTSPSGSTPATRMTNAGISWRSVGENIIAGYKDGISANNGWLNSSGHRSNMFGNFTYLGVGGATGGSYGIYFTEGFYS